MTKQNIAKPHIKNINPQIKHIILSGVNGSDIWVRIAPPAKKQNDVMRINIILIIQINSFI